MSSNNGKFNKAAFFSLPKLTPVDIEGFGRVYVRELLTGEMSMIAAEADKMDNTAIMYAFIAATVVNKNGEKVFSLADIKKLASVPFKRLAEAWRVIREVNYLEIDSEAVLEKSAATPN